MRKHDEQRDLRDEQPEIIPLREDVEVIVVDGNSDPQKVDFDHSLQIVEGLCYRHDRSEHWAEKHDLSWREAEQCLSVFVNKYKKLPVKSPRLPALMFELYRTMIDKRGRQMHWKWLRSAPVKRYVETQIPEKGRLFGLQYWVKDMCRK